MCGTCCVARYAQNASFHCLNLGPVRTTHAYHRHYKPATTPATTPAATAAIPTATLPAPEPEPVAAGSTDGSTASRSLYGANPTAGGSARIVAYVFQKNSAPRYTIFESLRVSVLPTQSTHLAMATNPSSDPVHVPAGSFGSRLRVSGCRARISVMLTMYPPMT